VREEVRGACEMLGLDPLYVANEGKLLAFVAPMRPKRCWRRCGGIHRERRRADRHRHRYAHPGLVLLRTPFGTTRIVDMLPGDQLPRIC
jgi:hydrogenase expression/formation protein HypE